jgi:transketolase
VGDEGEAIGMTTFGASAPQPDLYEFYGFTPEKVAERARAVVERVSARA